MRQRLASGRLLLTARCGTCFTPWPLQVEYAINDGGRPWQHAHPRFYERLLRRLLAMPSRPLVMGLMMHSFHRHQASCRGTLRSAASMHQYP